MTIPMVEEAEQMAVINADNTHCGWLDVEQGDMAFSVVVYSVCVRQIFKSVCAQSSRSSSLSMRKVS